MKNSRELIDWYWNFGCKRATPYELDSTSWLDLLYTADRIIRTASKSIENPRSCSMALWGTSQTGKSTLLSSYLDGDDDGSGRNSALTWDGGPPIRFCRKNLGETPPPETVVLNPYNDDSDASSCISRFQLVQSVENPQYTVEIRFASPDQIMHAFAMGYVSECSLRRGKNGELAAILFDPTSFREAIENFSVKNTKQLELAPDSQAAYGRLHELAELVDSLILSGVSRYEALESRNGVPVARPLILKALSATPDTSSVDRLCYELLWDDKPAITDIYERLRDWINARRNEWRDRPVFASAEVASLILDAAVYSRLHHKTPGTREENQRRVNRIRVQLTADRVNLGLDPNMGTPLFNDAEDFGSLQGCVMELVIPVRSDVVQHRAKFFNFLSESDLLDFPGTGRAHDNRETRLDLHSLAPNEKQLLLTRVLKRGKTASIVAAYSRDLTIDGFSIFSKVRDTPGQPQQLTTGIRTWWGYYGYDSRKIRSEKDKSPLPLNIVLSFWGLFLSQTAPENVETNGVAQIFDNLRPLDILASPRTVTRSLAVTYEHLKGAELPDTTTPNFKNLINKLKHQKEFQEHFQNSWTSFDAMIENGGSDYLFEVLLDQARTSPKRGKLLSLRTNLESDLERLFLEALPGQNDDARFRRSVERWADRIDRKINADNVQSMSFMFRRLMHCPSEILDPIPQNARNSNEVIAFVANQLNHWRDNAKTLATRSLTDYGFEDERGMSDAVTAITDSIDQSAVVHWVREYLGHFNNRRDALSGRSFLSQKLSRVLMPIHDDRANVNHEDIYDAMILQQNHMNLTGPTLSSSPHYSLFVKSFLDYLRKLSQNLGEHVRPQLPGDNELADIYEQFYLAVQGANR